MGCRDRPLGLKGGLEDWEVATSFLSTDHKLKTGTNTKKALLAVYNMMSWAGDTPPEGWNRTRHVIILMTDGQKGSLLPSSPPSPSCVALQSTCNIRLMVGAPGSNRPEPC